MRNEESTGGSYCTLATGKTGVSGCGHWKILMADARPDVHDLTRLVLEEFTFEGRRVECLSAFSSAEARSLVIEHPDAAVLLLDVDLETPDAGLELAEFIRGEAGNRLLRIIVRTGGQGEIPESEVVTGLDINDYRLKSELTADRLITAVTTAIRSYRDLRTIEEGRRGLHLLAKSVAHQIRNRTVAIAGFANLLRRRMEGEGDPAQWLATILEETGRLESMVGEVTRYTSLEMGELRVVGIRDLIERAMDQAESKSGRTVEWEVLCPDQPVRVDPVLAVTAFEAVLRNAVDFSPDVPKVAIRVSPGSLACVVEVEDHGSGIGAGELEHVFDPFYSTKSKGAGMGLAVVRKVAMEHQWDVALRSKAGQGTVVRIVIPRRELTGLA